MRQVTRRAICGVLLAVSAVWSQAEVPSAGPRVPALSLMTNAGYSVPLPPYMEAYAGGISADYRVAYRLPSAVRVTVFAGGNYTHQWLDMVAPEVTASVFSFTFEAGLGFSLFNLSGFSLTPYAVTGWGGGATAWNLGYSTYQPEVGGGIWADIALGDRFGLYADASYRWVRNFMSNFRIAVGARYALSLVPPASPGRLFDIRYQRVFPAFYKYYARNPLATASLINVGEQPIEDLEVTFFVEEYMANPQRCAAPRSVAPGERVPVEFFALFSPGILGVSEGVEVQAVIETRYTVQGRQFSQRTVESVRVEDRNAMTWEDDARAAAFVTALDQTVLAFMKNSMSAVERVSAPTLDKNVLRAITAFHALGLFGISYVEDPNTPYAEFSANADAVDFLQFPRQTLVYGAGDCDDLTILYCALLESVGTRTAFITVPGHILAAVEVDRAMAEVAGGENVIVARDRAWMPVEVTMLRQGFDQAWRAGADQWNLSNKDAQARLIPLDEAWSRYEPVGFSSDLAQISWPEGDRLASAVSDEVTRLVRRQIAGAEDRLLTRLATTPDDPALLNRLGVLYASNGLRSEARAALERAAASGHAPALVNLGNLLFLDQEYVGALEFYTRALERDTRVAAALLGVARCHYAAGNYSAAARAFDQLNGIAPDLAREYAYVAAASTGATRAGTAAAATTVPWMEDEE